MSRRSGPAIGAALLALAAAACTADAPVGPQRPAAAPAAAAALTPAGDAIITNGTIKLGINKAGFLGLSGRFDTGRPLRDSIGLVHLPTGLDGVALSTESGNYGSEGWGLAAFYTPTQAVSSEASFGGAVSSTLTQVSFEATESSAVSVMTLRSPESGAQPFVRATHDFHPAPGVPELYELAVTLENVSARTIPDLRYTRQVFWRISGFFVNYSTIQGSALEPNVLRATDGGASFNPLFSSRGPVVPGAVGDFVDAGPASHGAHLDLSLGELAPGAKKTVYFYYGAAGSEAAAVAAAGQTGARLYALGQRAPSGSPVTFVFAYKGRTNAPPVVRINGPFTAAPGETVSFSAAGTTDPDGDALTYRWDFGDGTTGSGIEVSHVYTSPQSPLTVTLTVTDARGATSTATATVTILRGNQLPFAEANGPYAAEVGAPVAFSSAGSRDPDGGALTYRWEFGDGATSTEPSPSHAYAAAGTYTARLTVTNPAGRTGTDVAGVTIGAANRPPVVTVALSAHRVAVGERLLATPSATDPDGGPRLTCTVSFGDGSAVTILFFNCAGDQGPVAHSYAAPGLYTVTVSARDLAGAVAEASDTVRVVAPETNTPPEIVNLRGFPEGAASYPLSGASCYGREQVCIKYTLRDADAGDNPFTTTVQWGDDTPAYVENSIPAENVPLLAFHKYASPGTYTVTVTATDRRGASSARTLNLTIAP